MTEVGAIAMAVAAASLALALFGPRGPLPQIEHPERASLAIVAPALSIRRWEAIRCACAIAGVAVLSRSAFAPLGLLAAFVPSVVLRWRIALVRERAASRSLDILRSAHAALRSGLPLVEALRTTLGNVEPLVGDPFARALDAFQLNTPLADAFARASGRARDRRVALALDALALVADQSLPAARAATVIGSVADRLSFEARLGEEVRARASGLRAQIVLLALLVPALALYLVVTVPGLSATLATPLGTHVLVPAAALFEIAGIIASRAIVRDIAA